MPSALCSPQMAMDPMPMAETVQLVRDHAAEFHGVAAWPAQPKLVPTVIVCEFARQFPFPQHPLCMCRSSIAGAEIDMPRDAQG